MRFFRKKERKEKKTTLKRMNSRNEIAWDLYKCGISVDEIKETSRKNVNL